MRNKIWIILPMMILLVGCDPQFGNSVSGDSATYLENNYIPWEGGTISDLAKGVFATISYEDDPINYFKSPKEIWDSRRGDCEDFCILMAYVWYQETGEKLQFAAYRFHSYEPYHMILIHDGTIYDPTVYGNDWPADWLDWYPEDVLYFSFDYVMGRATNNWTK